MAGSFFGDEVLALDFTLAVAACGVDVDGQVAFDQPFVERIRSGRRRVGSCRGPRVQVGVEQDPDEPHVDDAVQLRESDRDGLLGNQRQRADPGEPVRVQQPTSSVPGSMIWMVWRAAGHRIPAERSPTVLFRLTYLITVRLFGAEALAHVRQHHESRRRPPSGLDSAYTRLGERLTDWT
jgi:hypothetical protein